MKLEFEIDGQSLSAEFTAADGAAQLEIGGQTHAAEVSRPEPRFYVLRLNNRVYRCELEKSPSGETEVVVNGRRIAVAVRDKKHLRGNAGGGAGASGKVSLISPMPGKVVRVLLNAGDEVEANHGVLIVEAMKMQNEVLSPKAGKVAEVRVTEGQTVNAGEVLAVIE